MGMDVFGKSPSHEQGEYWRSSVWGWRPLWSLCIAIDSVDAPVITDEIAEACRYNDGAGLDDAGSKALARKLRQAVDAGAVAQWISDREAHVATLPREVCKCCGGSGVRADAVGVSMGQPDRALDADVAAQVGRTHGWCNGCRGLGDKPHWESHYHVDVETVILFAAFLASCGGFKVN